MSNPAVNRPTSDRTRQPNVGISACLMGENVRYDGGNKAHKIIQEEVAPWVNLQQFCPEVAANMGVPRPPVNLFNIDGEISALGVEDSTLDVTQSLSEASLKAVKAWGNRLSAYIVKARSPSCGSGTTPIYNRHQEVTSMGDGVFAAALKKANRKLIIVDESFFVSRETAQAFINSCYITSQKAER